MSARSAFGGPLTAPASTRPGDTGRPGRARSLARPAGKPSRRHAITYGPGYGEVYPRTIDQDPFLIHLDRENHTAQAQADVAREEGNEALAERLEQEEAERTIAAQEAHGYEL